MHTLAPLLNKREVYPWPVSSDVPDVLDGQDIMVVLVAPPRHPPLITLCGDTVIFGVLDIRQMD